MFLLLLEFSLGPDPCEDETLQDVRSVSQQRESMLEPNSVINDRVLDQQQAPPHASLLMGLPRSQGGIYFTAGLLTCLAQKSVNLAALYLSFVIIGSGESVRDVVLDTTGLFFLYDIDGESTSVLDRHRSVTLNNILLYSYHTILFSPLFSTKFDCFTLDMESEMAMGLNRFHEVDRRDSEAIPRARAELDQLRANLLLLRDEARAARHVSRGGTDVLNGSVLTTGEGESGINFGTWDDDSSIDDIITAVLEGRASDDDEAPLRTLIASNEDITVSKSVFEILDLDGSSVKSASAGPEGSTVNTLGGNDAEFFSSLQTKFMDLYPLLLAIPFAGERLERFSNTYRQLMLYLKNTSILKCLQPSCFLAVTYLHSFYLSSRCLMSWITISPFGLPWVSTGVSRTI